MGYLSDYANAYTAIQQHLGDTKAQAQLQRGAIYGNALNQIGQTVASIPGEKRKLADYARAREAEGVQLENLKLDLAGKRQAVAEEKQADEIMKKYTDEANPQWNIEGGGTMPMGPPKEINYTGAIRELRAKGLTKKAGELQTQVIQQRKDDVAAVQEHIKDVDTRMNGAYKMFKGIETAEDFNQIMPLIVKQIGSDDTGQEILKVFSGMFPNGFDKAAVERVKELGRTETESVARKGLSVRLAREALGLAKDSAEFTKSAKDAIAVWVSSINDGPDAQKQYDAAKTMFDHTFRVPGDTARDQMLDDILTEYGPTFNKEIKARALRDAMGPVKIAEMNQRRAEAGQARMDANQIRVVMNYENAMNRLRDDEKATVVTGQNDVGEDIRTPKMTAAEVQAAHEQLNASYKALYKKSGLDWYEAPTPGPQAEVVAPPPVEPPAAAPTQSWWTPAKPAPAPTGPVVPTPARGTNYTPTPAAEPTPAPAEKMPGYTLMKGVDGSIGYVPNDKVSIALSRKAVVVR